MIIEKIDRESIIYCTGTTDSGIPLIGGIWKLWEQHGFPIEASYINCKTNNWKADWMEAMSDASTTNSCPALMKYLSVFLTSDDIVSLKMRFVSLYRKSGESYEVMLADKKKNGKAFDAFASSVLSKSTNV